MPRLRSNSKALPKRSLDNVANVATVASRATGYDARTVSSSEDVKLHFDYHPTKELMMETHWHETVREMRNLIAAILFLLVCREIVRVLVRNTYWGSGQLQ